MAEGAVAFATGPFDAVGEEPGFVAGLLAAMGDVPKAFGSFAKGLFAPRGEAAAVGSVSLGAVPLAAMGEVPMAFAAGSFAKGLLAAMGEEPAVLGATPAAAPGPAALVAGDAAPAVSRSGARVAAGLFGEETDPLPAAVAVAAAVAVPAAAVVAPAATPVFLAGVVAEAVGSGLLVAAEADAPSLARVSGVRLVAPASGTAETSVSSTSESMPPSRPGGPLPPSSGGLLPLLPSTRIAAPHDLHLMVTCLPRTLRL
ncbi:MAG TPA: hypothetical protein VFU02_17020 [Polyangiaceae bacterium]|nr:hypothetical protein [Polyangiaceae bacterium]